MSTFFPNRETYEALYARYLDHPPEALLNAAELKTGESLLDLCAGNLRLARQGRAMGAVGITAVDESFDMSLGADHTNINCYHVPVDHMLERCILSQKTYEVVACQQAINYWLTPALAKAVSQIMRPKVGRFVFNTFNTAPPGYPVFKEYVRDGLRFGEAYYMHQGMVYHVQMREGLAPHMSQFRWISPEEFNLWLSPHFVKVSRITEGKSDIWVCWAK